MKDSIGLYFNLEISDRSQALSLVTQSLKQIERFENAGTPIGYWQLRANELSDSLKEVWLKIDSKQGTYIESASSHRWRHAFEKSVGNIEDRILCEQIGYTRGIAPTTADFPESQDSVLVEDGLNNGIPH
jgi:hypothetical protein